MTAIVLAAKLPSAGALAAIVAGAAIVIAALAWLFRRDEQAFPLLVVLALPFRVPISADGRTVNLLVPLYLVIAGGIVGLLLPRLFRRGEAQRSAPGAPAPGAGGPAPAAAAPQRVPAAAAADPAVRWAQLALLAAVVLYALQAIYSDDRAKAAENLAFFYIPFGLMFLLLRDVRWTRELLLRCLGVMVVLAVLFAGVGFVEYARKSLFLNPKVVAANQYDNYFRVNSVFFDPSVYGRFLALVMIALTTAVLWGRRRAVLAGAAILAWLLAGLVTSFSQSSIVALLLGLAVLAAYRWGLRRTSLGVGALVALAGAVLLLAPASWHFGLTGKGGSTSNATSGRASLIEGGLELFGDRPLQGFGSGSFEKQYRAHSRTSQQNATSASHTIPITVAAEQGLIGLVVYLVLIVTALLALFDRAGRSPPRIAIAACFAALVLHTWTYADFLEDPFTWALLAIGLALARGGVAQERAVSPDEHVARKRRAVAPGAA
ncbi:MAG TPA: O-antigen ligase family protein [Solirubrobacteraceae bacterium]